MNRRDNYSRDNRKYDSNERYDRRSRSRSRSRENRRDHERRDRPVNRDRDRYERQGETEKKRDDRRDDRREDRRDDKREDRRDDRREDKKEEKREVRREERRDVPLRDQHITHKPFQDNRVSFVPVPIEPSFESEPVVEEDRAFNESELNVLEEFMAHEESDEDEDAKAERLAAERKKRREDILKKHSSSSMELEPRSSDLGDSKADNSIPHEITSSRIENDTVNDSKPAVAVDDDQQEAVESSLNSHAKAIVVETDDAIIELLHAERVAIDAADEQDRRNKAIFDMFSSSPSDLERMAAGGARARVGASGALAEGEDPHLQSNWDDVEGYYKARIGEVIQGRYRTLGVVGKGVFSTVIKCVDLLSANSTTNVGVAGGSNSKDTQAVAIKMIRSNDTMRKAADKEKAILTMIAERDPQNKKHCVRLLDSFDYRSHIAMVFEYQQMNLREALKKFGKDVGINIGAIRLYAKQLFYALKHLSDLRIVHADIKLDNILCSGDLKQVILCDFGSAFWETDSDCAPTPYLVSRFYRAPEIILGQQYDRNIDMWSVGVSLYELFTGHVMFPGRTNNEMLKLIMAIKGKFPNKQLKTHLRQAEVLNMEPHFDVDLRFKQYELDPVTGKVIMRLVDIVNPTRDLTSIFRSAKAGSEDIRLVAGLTSLLDQCLALDPTRRMSVSDALKHPFFTTK